MFMKLLFYVASMRQGGAEKVLALITSELSGRGHSVTIASDFSDGMAYDINNNIKLIDLNIDTKPKSNIFSKLVYAFRITHIIHKTTVNENPDAVISFMPGMNKYVIPSLSCTKYPVVASEHSTFNKSETLFNKIARWHLNKYADKVTILTQYDKHFIGKRLKNTIVMPNPLSVSPVTLQQFEQIESRRKNIMACGSVKRYLHKGFDNLLESFAIIAPKYPDIELDIVGDYDDKSLAFLENIADSLSIRERVHFIGKVNNISKLLLEHKFFVLSSRQEGMPMVLMEAMAMGCACISYDCISGPNEIITHNEDGLLVEGQNKKQLALALASLIDDDDKRKRLASRAIVNIKRFSLKNITDRWDAMLNDIVKK